MDREELVAHWRTLVGCMLAASVGAMGFYIYTIGSFVPALIADAGYTKGQLSLGSLFVAGSTALCAPFAGILMDRFGALRIVGLVDRRTGCGTPAAGGLAGYLSGVHRLPGPVRRRRGRAWPRPLSPG